MLSEFESLIPRVVVVHPGRQHVYETVMAAQDAGMLERFVTGFYRKDFVVARPLQALFPRVERTLRRRWHPEIDSGRVTILPAFHLISRIATPLARSMAHSPMSSLDRWAEVNFDRFVAHWLQRHQQATILHAFEGVAYHVFRVARKLGIFTVLDVPSAYESYLKEVNQERRRHGLTITHFPSHHMAVERSRADVLLAPSEYVERCLLEQGVPSNRIALIRYGADPERFSPPTKTSNRTFRALFVGRVDFRKGAEYLLSAWKKAALTDSELVIAGGIGEESRGLLRDLPKNVRLINNVPFPAIRELYQASDVFILPSLAEGSALVVYEAMAAGLPVIVTPNCGAVARDGVDGYLVEARDSDAIADRLLHLAARPELRAQMGASGRRLIVEKYTWRHYRRRLAAAYQAIADGRPVQQAVDTVSGQAVPTPTAAGRVGC
jgi:glycosyltransferase involved in cell wall biosynthesis